MLDKFNVGDKLVWVVDELDGHFETPCTVIDVKPNRALAEGDGMTIWIYEGNEYMFRKDI